MTATAVSPPPLPRSAPAPSLLTAPILPALLRFALPNMVGMLATALATIAETAYVGSFGVPSLAGMALVFPMLMLQMMLSGGAMGGGVAAAGRGASAAAGGGTAGPPVVVRLPNIPYSYLPSSFFSIEGLAV